MESISSMCLAATFLASGGTYFASLDGREKRLLVGGNTFAMYASGFLLYLREIPCLHRPSTRSGAG